MHTGEVYEKLIFIGTGRRSGILDCPLAGITGPGTEQREYHAALEHHLFGYVTSGCGFIEANGESHSVKAGDFYFIRKGTSVYCSSEGEEPWEKMWFRAEGSMVEDLIRTFCLGDLLIREINVRRHFLEIHDHLASMNEKRGADAMARVACLLFEILSEVQKEKFFASTGQKISTGEAIKTYLDNNIYNDISLEGVAEEFGISKMHVIRLFRKEYGTTPMQYLIERKVNIAKSLLAETIMPIKEISDLLRYSNTQHFSNTFKHAVGTSPNQYRRSAREKQ